MLSRFLSSLAAAFLAVLTFVSVSAGSERMRVRVAYAGFGAGTIVTSIARDKHFFAKYGLDLDAVYLDRAATGGVQSLLGIDIFVSSEDVLPALEAAGEGADLVFFGGHVRPENYRFGVASYVDHLAQLKGKKVGVSNLGRKSDLIARVVLRRAGLDPVKDVEMVPIGFSPQRMAAIYRNIVQGAPLVPQVAAEARRVGIKVLDIGQVNLVNDLLVTSRSFCQPQPRRAAALPDGLSQRRPAFPHPTRRQHADHERARDPASGDFPPRGLQLARPRAGAAAAAARRGAPGADRRGLGHRSARP